uniref:Uncharacterized protein n=1 Tax=Rhizophora mucronata TaxID=61149 RepID=A0A2P2IYS1_RHIMU
MLRQITDEHKKGNVNYNPSLLTLLWDMYVQCESTLTDSLDFI